ncbi:hypothetical protein FHT29_000802 [Rhizobium sp. SG741]|nr:hypothetical protein [Rhizobium sp. SG741]
MGCVATFVKKDGHTFWRSLVFAQSVVAGKD